MFKVVEEEAIHDNGYPGNVYQTMTIVDRDVRVCDLCGSEIRFNEKIIKGSGNEDICTCCVTSGNARKFYAALVSGMTLETEMKFILSQI